MLKSQLLIIKTFMMIVKCKDLECGSSGLAVMGVDSCSGG